MFDYDKTVGSIYDCAANPELWVETLAKIRDELGVAYLMVGYVDMTPTLMNQMPIFTFRHTEWDVARLHQLQALTNDVPGAREFQNGVPEKAWTQMEHISREDFEKTRFCQEWSDPQQLSDCLIVPYVARPRVFGLFTGALHKSQGEVFNDQQKGMAETLTPHIRRAMLINDLADKGKLALALYRQVLDQLSVAVFVVGLGRRIIFTNASGEAMLSDGNHVFSVAGTLSGRHTIGTLAALDDAIDRAASGDKGIGISGIGVPLVGANGERSAA
jgi:PAS domain-containing protein